LFKLEQNQVIKNSVIIVFLSTVNFFLAGSIPVFFKFVEKETGNGQFEEPNDIAIDSAGNIYLADTNLQLIILQKSTSYETLEGVICK
jgi:biopolymer transport protein ExbD